MTSKQWISIVLVVLGVLTASTAQLTDLFGEESAKLIISVASMANSALAGILAVLTGQSSTVKEVQAMPGVEAIVVNKWANMTLATLAHDQEQKKILVKAGDEQAVEDTATTDL